MNEKKNFISQRFSNVSQKSKKKIIWFLSVFFLFIAFSRFSFIGQFFDDVFFRLLFGWARYFVYLAVFFTFSYFFWSKQKFKFKKKQIICFFWIFFNLIFLFGLIGLLSSAIQNNFSFYQSFVIWDWENVIHNFEAWKNSSIFADFQPFEWPWAAPLQTAAAGGLIGFIIASFFSIGTAIIALAILIFSFFLFYSYLITDFPFFYFFSSSRRSKIKWENLNRKKNFAHIGRIMRKIKIEDFTMELPSSQKIIDQEIALKKQPNKNLKETQEMHQLLINKNNDEKVKKTSWNVDLPKTPYEGKTKEEDQNNSENSFDQFDEPDYYEDENSLENAPWEESASQQEELDAKAPQKSSSFLNKNLPDEEIWSFSEGDNEENKRKNIANAKVKREALIMILQEHKVQVKVDENSYVGANVTKYQLQLEKGARVQSLLQIQKEIELGLGEKNVRIETPIAGTNSVGIEIPNLYSTTVCWKEMLGNLRQKKNSINLAIGKNVMNKICTLELEKLPHLLVAGSTGGGKSVCLNSIVMSMIFQKTPLELKLLLIDPKRVELTTFKNLPHLLGPVISDTRLTSLAFSKILQEIEKRYQILEAAGLKNLASYNDLHSEKPLPAIVVVIDELADLILLYRREIETKIVRISQIGRAVGIHLVVATQRPSSDIITGLIKTNIPGRIAFSVTNHFDSRTIMDKKGAEKLLGRGDLLYLNPSNNSLVRAQGVFVNDQDIQIMNDFWTKQNYSNYYWPEFANLAQEYQQKSSAQGNKNFNDEIYTQVKEWIKTQKEISISSLQRSFQIGYNRSARICEQLEAEGLVGAPGPNQRREVKKNKNVN